MVYYYQIILLALFIEIIYDIYKAFVHLNEKKIKLMEPKKKFRYFGYEKR